MLQVKNTQVAFLIRSLNAVSNSYTTGEIDTRSKLEIPDFYNVPVSKGEDAILRAELLKYQAARKLAANLDAHQSHDAYLKGIQVVTDIKYPSYWSPEFQRYHFAEIIMSQSTMHSIMKFITGEGYPFNSYTDPYQVKRLQDYVAAYQNATTDKDKYDAFMHLRSNLPAGFEMWMTFITNYLQLKTIYIQRHNHKLKEDWVNSFCSWIKTLPLFKELCLEKFLKEGLN